MVFLNTIDNSLSSSNYKYISPEIYGTDLKDLKYKKIYPKEYKNYEKYTEDQKLENVDSETLYSSIPKSCNFNHKANKSR